MNVEAAALIKGVRGPKRVRGSAAGNVGELEHDVAPEKCGVACALSKPTEQKKSHWTVPAPALLSPPMQPSAKAPQQSSPSPGDPGEESVQTQFSEARPHYDGLHIGSDGKGHHRLAVCAPELRSSLRRHRCDGLAYAPAWLVARVRRRREGASRGE